MEWEKIQINAVEHEPTNRPHLNNYNERLNFFQSKFESISKHESEEVLNIVMDFSNFISQVEFDPEKQYQCIDNCVKYLLSEMDSSPKSLIYVNSLEIFCTLIKESKYYFKLLINNKIVELVMKNLFKVTGNDLFDYTRFKILILIFRKKSYKKLLKNYLTYDVLAENYCFSDFGPITKLNILYLLRIYIDIVSNDDFFSFIKIISFCFQHTDNVECLNELILITCILAQTNNDNSKYIYSNDIVSYLSKIDLNLLKNDAIINLLLIYKECTRINNFIDNFDFDFVFELALHENIKISSNSMTLIASIIMNGNDNIQLKCLHENTMQIILKGLENGTKEMKYSAIIIYGNLCLNSTADIIADNLDLPINQYLIEILQTSDDIKFQLLIIGVFGSLISKLSSINNFSIIQLLDETGTIEFLLNMQVNDDDKQIIINSFINLISNLVQK